MAPQEDKHIPITPTASRRRLGWWLGRLGVAGFGLGAMTSAALAMHIRQPLWQAGDATASQAVSLGVIAQALSDNPLGAFPEPTVAEGLCASLPTSSDTTAATTSPPSEALATGDGPITSTLSLLSRGVTPEFPRQLGAVPWPGIHDMAQMARVPVLMYHDILTEKEVFFDVTPEELAAHFEQIEAAGLTPISLEKLVDHLRTGAPLPPKPIVLTFDDGYEGHYTHAYELIQEYDYPATFSIFTDKPDGEVAGRSTVSWAQLEEMAADPLVTIAAHSVTHPPDLRTLSDADLQREVVDAKARLEEKLGITVEYFTYPAGHYDERVAEAVAEAGYRAALTMSNDAEWFAGESENLLAIGRFGQSRLESLLSEAWEGLAVPVRPDDAFDFSAPIRVARQIEMEEVPLALISGGRPVTVHADSRYQLTEILARTNAIAAVDGGFFSLKYLDSNVMIGPVLSQATQTFVPGNDSENPKLNGRPLVLIGPDTVKFVPFEADAHNTLSGIQAELSNVTDAFVGAAWLVREGEPQPAASFGSLFDYDAMRHRAFWGINKAGQPVIGVTKGRVDSVTLGEVLHRAGFRDAIMVDSGASTSLAYREESLVEYIPRPVPHIVALLPPEQATGTCPLVFQDEPLTEADLAAARE